MVITMIVIIGLFVKFYFNGKFDSVETLQEYMKTFGVFAPMVLIGFQALQVVVPVMPGLIGCAAGAILFGTMGGFWCNYIGICAGSIVAYFLARKFGTDIVLTMFPREQYDKWCRILKKGKYFGIFLFVATLLPLFPDDILCFVSGLSSMTWQYFVVMITLARSVGIAATCYSVNFIPFNTWWGVLIWCALIALIAVSFVAMYKNLDALNDFFKRRFRVFRKTRRAKNAAQTSTQTSTQTSARGGAQNKAEKKSA